MRKLAKFLNLPLVDAWLLTRVAILLFVTRSLLFLLPLKLIQRVLVGPRSRLIEPRVVWAIETCARSLPFAGNCLAKALVACTLLESAGQKADLRIGVAKAGGALQAHAWVESGGRVILGIPERDPGYRVLTSVLTNR